MRSTLCLSEMAFQSAGADQPKRNTTLGSASVSTGSGEATSETGTDSSAANTSMFEVLSDADNPEENRTNTEKEHRAESPSSGEALGKQENSTSEPAPVTSSLNPPAKIFPSLPEQLLRDLQAVKQGSEEQDIEKVFAATSIAFKTDLLTLSERVELQSRWRDQAEKNMIQEENNLRSAIQNLYKLCKDSTSIEIVTKVKEQVDILRWAVDWVSTSAESVGAIQQEKRVSNAMEVMLQYVENLKRIHQKQDEEEKKRLKILNGEDIIDSDDIPSRTLRHRSLQSITGANKSGSKRRASIAVMPRPIGTSIEVSKSSLNMTIPAVKNVTRSCSLPRSGSFPRRLSTSPSTPSTPSSASNWDPSERLLDSLEKSNPSMMDNIEELTESRRESCMSRAETEDHGIEENNNCSLKQSLSDSETDDLNCIQFEESITKQIPHTLKYSWRQECISVFHEARDIVLEHFDPTNIVRMLRRTAAFFLILSALYYLIAMFFEPASADRTNVLLNYTSWISVEEYLQTFLLISCIPSSHY